MTPRPRTTPMTENQYEKLLQEIRTLDAKFSAALTAGLAALNTALLALTETHHKAQLEQERRNAKFASTDQVNELARRLDGFAEGAGRRDEQIKALRNSNTTLTQDAERTNNQQFSLLQSTTGFVIMGAISASAVILSFVLTHLHP